MVEKGDRREKIPSQHKIKRMDAKIPRASQQKKGNNKGLGF